MKLAWIGAFALLLASLTSLISTQQSGRLVEESWASAANVLPDAKLTELQRTSSAYTARLFGLFPDAFRQKVVAKTWTTVELITLRSLLLWHLAPALVIPLIVGFVEGSWARSSHNTLIRMHSPMRFSLALTALGLTPVVAILWVAAPIALSARLLVLALGAITIFGTHNLIVHAPTQF